MVDPDEEKPVHAFRVTRVVLPPGFEEALARFVNEVAELRILSRLLPAAADELKEARLRALGEAMRKGGPTAVQQAEELGRALQRALDEEEAPPIVVEHPETADAIQAMIEAFVLPEHTRQYLGRMVLVYLISRFEEFLVESIAWVFAARPEMLRTREKAISYEEALDVGEPGAIHAYLAQREARAIVAEDVARVESILRRRFRVSLKDAVDWPAFAERFYRRHAIVHAMGRPDETYRRKTGTEPQEEALGATGEYLEASFDLFVQAAEAVTAAFAEAHGKALRSEES